MVSLSVPFWILGVTTKKAHLTELSLNGLCLLFLPHNHKNLNKKTQKTQSSRERIWKKMEKKDEVLLVMVENEAEIHSGEAAMDELISVELPAPATWKKLVFFLSLKVFILY